jgi:pimeloyl-ACP methyl ester carboxylesterase
MFKIPEKELVKLNDCNSKARGALFILPGIEGSTALFVDLAQLLARSHIQVFGLEFSVNSPTNSIESIADSYRSEINAQLTALGLASFSLAGYSYGGLIAIQLARIYHTKCDNLFLFESSHHVFRYGVYSNSLIFDQVISNESFLDNKTVFAGSLSVYAAFMIGQVNSKEIKMEFYQYLMGESCESVQACIDKLFDYIHDKYYEFDASTNEKEEAKTYMRVLILKSNAGHVFELEESERIGVARRIILFRSKKFLYQGTSGEKLFYLDKNNNRVEFKFSKEDFNLSQILRDPSRFQIVHFERGNHWSFVNENRDEISQIIKHTVLNEPNSRL